MTLTFKYSSLDILIARAQRIESDSCGMNTEITNLLTKLKRLKLNGMTLPIGITLDEQELKLMEWL